MPRFRSISIRGGSLILAILTVVAGASIAAADVIVMHDGRILRGEILEQNSMIVKMRVEAAGLWTTTTFDRRDIEKIYLEEGDQSDTGDERPTGETTPARPAPSGAVERSRPAVAIVPLHGHVGGAPDQSKSTEGGGSFDAALLEACFEQASKDGVRTIILDIRSPGGRVDEMEAICETILNWNDRLRIVAWPDEAFSAAAIIAMCCPEMIVRADALIGAATIVEESDGGGLRALDAKMASPHYARQRQYMAKSGRPYEVVAAMTIQETRLWWSPQLGFATEPPPTDGAWAEVDGATTILTCTGDDAIRWGLATGRADDVGELLEALAIDSASDIVNFDSVVARHNANVAKGLDDLQRQFEAYLRGLASMNQNMIALFEAIRKQDQRSADEARRAIARESVRVQTAGRQIQRVDRALLARRVEVPDELMKRVDEDLELLRHLGRLVNSGSTEGLSEAGQRLGTILTAWKTLLGL